MKVTVKDRRGVVASGEVLVRDVEDDGDVAAAAKSLCKALGVLYPAPARITVEEAAGRRWRFVRELVA